MLYIAFGSIGLIVARLAMAIVHEVKRTDAKEAKK